MKTKRKDVDRVNDEFSELSLSSPALKIRRLDPELSFVMEENDAEMTIENPMEEESKPEAVNDDRAIVVLNPLQQYNANLYVHPDFITGLKNNFLWSNYSRYDQFSTTQLTESYRKPQAVEIIQLDETGEDAMMEEATMDMEEDCSTSSRSSTPLPQVQQQQHQFIWGLGATGGNKGLHQWQQQQQSSCMISQPPQPSSTPISWSI